MHLSMLCRRVGETGHGGGGDLIVFVSPGVGHLTDLVLPGAEGIFESFFARRGDTWLPTQFQICLTHRSLKKNLQLHDRTMFSLLEGLLHCISRAISSNVKRRPFCTFARKWFFRFLCFICIIQKRQSVQWPHNSSITTPVVQWPQQ